LMGALFDRHARLFDGLVYDMDAFEKHPGADPERFLLEMRGVPMRSVIPKGTLIVTSGFGLVQREGGSIEEIRPGDVVWFAPGEKHWHGASPAVAMTHIAIQEALEGKVVTCRAHSWRTRMKRSRPTSSTKRPAFPPAFRRRALPWLSASKASANGGRRAFWRPRKPEASCRKCQRRRLQTEKQVPRT
jgi:hypothetical protein